MNVPRNRMTAKFVLFDSFCQVYHIKAFTQRESNLTVLVLILTDSKLFYNIYIIVKKETALSLFKTRTSLIL